MSLSLVNRYQQQAAFGEAAVSSSSKRLQADQEKQNISR
jgi:hypothetical protein